MRASQSCIILHLGKCCPPIFGRKKIFMLLELMNVPGQERRVTSALSVCISFGISICFHIGMCFLIQTFHRVFLIGTNCGLWFRLIEDFKVLWVFFDIANRRENQTFWFSSAILLISHSVILPTLWSSTNSKEIYELEQGESGVLRYNFSLFRSRFISIKLANEQKIFFSFHNLVAEYFGKWFVRNLISLDFLRIVCRRTR